MGFNRVINFFVLDGRRRYLNHVVLTEDYLNVSLDSSIHVYNSKFKKKCQFVITVDGYFVSLFFVVLNNSVSYRKCVASKLKELVSEESDIDVVVLLKAPGRDVIDYNWCDRLEVLVLERQELDHAMSWLSTLGGAFSALGDSFEHCAKVAGKISVKQFEIALRLGDPPMVARCRLYLALSLIQQDQLRIARKIIQEQFHLGKAHCDTRLTNMCRGVWAKLQYTHKLRKTNTVCVT